MIDPIEGPMATQNRRTAPWTFGRVLGDLSIIMVGVPLAIYSVKGVTNCGSDFLALSLFVGLFLFTLTYGWEILKSFNDWLDPYLPNHDPGPKPPPQDDF